MGKVARVALILFSLAVVFQATKEELNRQSDPIERDLAPAASDLPPVAESNVLETEILSQRPAHERIMPVVVAKAQTRQPAGELGRVAAGVPRHPRKSQPTKVMARLKPLGPARYDYRRYGTPQIAYSQPMDPALVEAPQPSGFKARIGRLFRRIKAKLSDL